ncbi:MAG TPA: helix-turn-helix domain-containing protein [Nocardioides sp.]|nr:helix-turn-helix domain-containing protein [Nocardioides sp.]
MTGAMLVDSSALPGGDRRAEVLSLLRRAERPLSAAEVAEAVGLHVNTARFHLDGLVDDRLAERTTESRETPGRPRILYTSEGPSPGPRSYEFLAEMLTGFVSSLHDAGPATVELGKAWGRHLVERAAPSEQVDAEEAVARLDRLLDMVGFQPDTSATATGAEVRLRHCPFLEVAQKHTDIVCAIHLGLMQGALDELDAPVAATSLEPFVTPQLCIAQLQATQAAS